MEEQSLRLYEGLFLFDANLASRDWPGIEKHVEELLKKHQGQLEYAERWPDRKLAYEVKGCRKGTYYLTYFHAPPTAISPLQRDCQLSERVLRVNFLQNEFVSELLEQRRERAATGDVASTSSGDSEYGVDDSDDDERPGRPASRGVIDDSEE